MHLGLGFTPSNIPNRIQAAAVFDFTAGGPSLPSGWTYTRTDAICMYRDSGGKLRLATSNTPRFNYTRTGTALGMLMEGARTNVCTNSNVTPAATTNVSVTGTAAISLVTDATALTAFNVETVCTGNVFEASGGASGGTVVIAGATGATGTFSAKLVARHTVGSGASFGITPNPTATAITGTAYDLFKAEGLASTATTDTMVITVPSGVTIRFILNQLEAGPRCTSLIKVSGAAATRASEKLADLSITSRTYFGASKGTIIAEFDFQDLTTTTGIQNLLVLSDTGDGSFTNLFRIYRVAATSRRKLAAQLFANSVNQATGYSFAADVGSVDAASQRFSGCIAWRDGAEVTVSSGSNSFYQNPLNTNFQSLAHLFVGNRNGTEQINGHIRKITFFKQYLTPQQINQYMTQTGDWLVSTCGQSNMTDWFSAQSGANNTGEINAKAVTDALWTTTRNFYVNGGTVGTSVKYYPATSTDANYWLDPATGNKGAPFRRWVSMNQGAKGTFKAIIDTSGESDAGNCTVQEFVNAQIAKFTIMRSMIGAVPVFLVPIGRNTAAQDGYQTVREAQWQLVGAQNPGWIYLCPERFDLALSDSIHMSDASAGTCATRAVRKMHKVLGDSISGGVDGPKITSVSRSGTTVTVTITHDSGTDFTPTSSIAGFHYYNGSDYLATENTITSAVRTNATTITLTLTSSSAGTLYYGKGSLSVDTIANLVKDNSTQTLPLHAGKWTVS